MSSKGKESVSKTFMVAGILCVACSVLVSLAAVGLRPIQEKNKVLDKKKNILLAAGLMEPGVDIAEVFEEKIKVRLVDLDTGEYKESMDASSYDQRKAAKDPSRSINLPASEDIAKIGRRANVAFVYEVYEGSTLKQVVLPVHGKGLWSTLYGFLAIKSDANTVVGLGFYEHAETPGLGGEVDNPKWKALWPGKKLYDEDHDEVAIQVLKGTADSSSENFEHQVDGLSGATLTTVGVDHLLKFWLGDKGFEQYLNKIRQRGNLNG